MDSIFFFSCIGCSCYVGFVIDFDFILFSFSQFKSKIVFLLVKKNNLWFQEWNFKINVIQVLNLSEIFMLHFIND